MPRTNARPSRQEQAARLRARGLSYSEVGKRLGVSKQCAHAMTKAHRNGKYDLREPIRCRLCQAGLNARGAHPRDHLQALCVACSAGRPFAERLKAHRIAAGLTVAELARRTGLAFRTIHSLQQGHVLNPTPVTVRKLARVLKGLKEKG